MVTKNPESTIHSGFMEFMGQLAEMCSFNRSIGQIYGVLYMAPEPLSLEEIAKACRMSKGNASIHVRTLENWGAVHASAKSGSRKDYYSANTDLKGLAIKRLQEGLTRRLDLAQQRIRALKDDPAFVDSLREPHGLHWGKRIEELESLIQQVQSGISILPKLAELKRFLPL